MRRREFIAGLGSTAAWPTAVRAQQTDMRRIGVLLAPDENDPQAKAFLSEFTRRLSELGWMDGGNVRIDVRAAGSADRLRTFAKELVDQRPDALLSFTTPATMALQREMRAIPVVFVNVADPVGAGFVASLARPGGNITGFSNLEASMSGKWLELLTEVAPGIRRVAMIFNPDTAAGGGSYFRPSFEAAARSRNVEPILAPVHSDAEIEALITLLGREHGSGLVVQSDFFNLNHRAQIILLAARNRVPAVYPAKFYSRDGGLLSYGPDVEDIFRRAATYVDRILRGAKPSDLPVQLPTKIEVILNMKTAKALGLMVPQSILLLADEVIE
jgi:putative tryptophan/tyrosine transport system substrate-binding protein